MNEWNGMEWSGVEWNGVEWKGMERNGTERNEWNGMSGMNGKECVWMNERTKEGISE